MPIQLNREEMRAEYWQDKNKNIILRILVCGEALLYQVFYFV